jgi:hypothetical protein
MAHLFLDTETTGVEDYDQVIEIAFAINDGPILVHTIEHTRIPTEWVFKNTGYMERIAFSNKIAITDWVMFLCDVWKKQNTGDTSLSLVCANPTFDERMIVQSIKMLNTTPAPTHLYLKSLPWSFRLIDLATSVMFQMGRQEPASLKDVGAFLGVPPNTKAHTAGGDVEHLRKCFYVAMERYCFIQ